LRELTVTADGVIGIAASRSGPLALSVTPPPYGAMRGHQLTDWGFFMTTPSFEQFARDLLVFGTNQVEFAHIDNSRGDQHKLIAWSAILDKYDLRVSLFNPPFATASDTNTSLAVFAGMARVDSLFHEGGSADELPMLATHAKALRQFHPNATAWLSPGGLDEVALESWLLALDTASTRAWLTGVAYGPGTHVSQKQLAERVPSGYALRQYPDITHSLAAMYPQPNWHHAWAVTHGRLVVNPSPERFGAIATLNQNATYSRFIGFGAYSEVRPGVCISEATSDEPSGQLSSRRLCRRPLSSSPGIRMHRSPHPSAGANSAQPPR
jgi:hypothetical protein